MPITRRRALGVLPALCLSACGGGGGTAPDPSSAATAQDPGAELGKAFGLGSAPASGSGWMRAASLGAGASLNGVRPFPADNPWNTDIRLAPVDPNSAKLIASIGLNTGLHPDFGAGLIDSQPFGIPDVVVSGQQPLVPTRWTAYGDESDPGP